MGPGRLQRFRRAHHQEDNAETRHQRRRAHPWGPEQRRL
jgi:hypothetical protein